MCLKIIYKNKNMLNYCRFMRSENASSLPSIYSYRKVRPELCAFRNMSDLQKGVSRIKCDGSVLPFPKVERWNRYSADPDPDFYGFSHSLPQNGGNAWYARSRSRFLSQPSQLSNQELQCGNIRRSAAYTGSKHRQIDQERDEVIGEWRRLSKENLFVPFT